MVLGINIYIPTNRYGDFGVFHMSSALFASDPSDMCNSDIHFCMLHFARQFDQIQGWKIQRWSDPDIQSSLLAEFPCLHGHSNYSTKLPPGTANTSPGLESLSRP